LSSAGSALPELTPAEFRHLRNRVLDLYTAVIALMILGIGVLVFYIVVWVGPLTSPGAQESFGLALALSFLMATVALHLVDRMYRVWPLGRTIHPTPPGPVTDRNIARFFRWAIVVAAAAGIAYLLGALIAG
jgi:MFS family permease